MNKIVALMVVALSLTGCAKVGVSGKLNQLVGDWAEVHLPDGCVAKQVAASQHEVVVLCEDGRVFH